MQVVEAMAERYAATSTRKAIDEADKAGDADTAGVFTETSRELDKHLYFLEAHLQGAASADQHFGGGAAYQQPAPFCVLGTTSISLLGASDNAHPSASSGHKPSV